MKKFILSLSLLSLFAVAGFAQEPAKTTTQPVTPPANPNQADIKFDKMVHDYGTIKQGADGGCEFKFTNTGKEPLIISNCQGSCGCTVPSCPKEPILPGKTGIIKVHYDTKRVGPITKTVMVQSNAKSGTLTIQIKGTVEAAPQDEPFPSGNTQKNGAPFEKGN
ncbi:MAG TPA: DUF1573 domain-containing protein [Bacteroidia bacterium]|jgi:hypothetical protein|nr:DUF1573 domain-containing protein [Bacteroidia bacterium]